MRALTIVPGTTTVHLTERPDAGVTGAAEVLMRVLRVGICGTDREEVSGGRARAPDGHSELVIGHEMLGQVVAIGSKVTEVAPGDYAVFTVRRGCGRCRPCAMGRSDMCATGEYLERGIRGLDGFQTDYVVDRETFVVRVPPELEPVGVLTEPLSIVEKAIQESIQIQAGRLPDAQGTSWLPGRRCLVAGLGPVGLLAALAIRLRGGLVYGLDIVAPDGARAGWLTGIGGTYLDGRQVAPADLEARFGTFDLVLDATGNAPLEFALLDVLGINGVYVVTGIPGGSRAMSVPGAELMRELVLKNQVMLGSVNASRDHFQYAIDDLGRACAQWGEHVSRLITHRHPCTDFGEAFRDHGPDEIKVVVEWHAGKPAHG